MCMTRSPLSCCYSSQDSIRSASTSQCRLASNCPHHVLQLRKVHTVSSLPCLFLYLSLLSSITCPRGPYPSLCPPRWETPPVLSTSLSTQSWSLNVFVLQGPCQEFTPAYLHLRGSPPPNTASGGTSPPEDRKGFRFPVLLCPFTLLPRG